MRIFQKGKCFQMRKFSQFTPIKSDKGGEQVKSEMIDHRYDAIKVLIFNFF